MEKLTAAKFVLDFIPTDLPILLKNQVAAKLIQLEITLHKKQLRLPDDEHFQQQLIKCLACSEFISNIILHHPELILELHNSQQLYRNFSTHDFVSEANQLIPLKTTEIELMTFLRRFRRKIMLRIAWRDITGIATLDETFTELSCFADLAINLSLRHIRAQLPNIGVPLDEAEKTFEFIILALGKLGSYELNFSSDIDLIFSYNQSQPEFEKYYHRLAQSLINVLSRTTSEGFVFRVDMRLRPYGSSGALVCSKKSMIAYYQSQGREWERFALSKARLVNPNVSGEELMQTIKQFTYRRYIDFSVIDSLREIKKLMRRESYGQEDNIKRGEGGIREIEFIVQVFQLIRGGKEPWFQNSSIFNMLPKLAEFNCLPNSIVQELWEAYKFLRTTEHHLQEINDQQTQRLPKTEIEQLQLTYSLNFCSWEDFIDVLHQHQKKVASHFNEMIADPKDTKDIRLTSDPMFIALIEPTTTDAECADIFNKIGAKNLTLSIESLKKFKNSFNFHTMHETAKPKLGLLLQQILPLVFENQNSDLALARILSLLERIIRRSVYIILLLENPLAIVQLVELCCISPWISDQIIKFPFLLEELIDSKTLYQPYSTEKLQDQLRQQMLGIPFDDLEAQMDCLRHFKQIQILRVAASDATGALPLMKVSDHLSNTASVIVGYAERIAWRSLVDKHGYPVANGEPLHWDDFAIIAYGKLGGLELGYGSDLDLVFLHAETKSTDMTDGEKPISNLQFYSRLAQRTIHILNTSTPMGKLYDVDTRLRPSGVSGLLVSSFESYSSYQLQSAWTWEHQALIRARIISGSNILAEKFATIRNSVLTKERDSASLRQDVVSMRQKMLEQLNPHADDLFDISNDSGGIKDIEFMVQYLALRYAHRYPEIVFYTDNIRILEALLKLNLLSLPAVKSLSHIYCHFREIIHRYALQHEKPLVKKFPYQNEIHFVTSLWRELFTL